MLLAQISDLHIRPSGEKLYDFIDTNSLLARHVALLNNYPEALDGIIITGDVTNCGTEPEYRMAKKILSQLEKPVFILPGNHDYNANFLAAFGAEYAYLGQDPGLICFAVERFPVRLVFVDSSVDGALHGNLGRNKLAWLSEVLAQEPDKPTALFMHHHPMASGCLHMDTIKLQDGEILLDVLTKFPQVRHIFCGHTHRAIFQQYRNLLIATAPSTAHQVPFNTVDANGFYCLEPPSMLIHRYHQATGLVSYVESLEVYPGPYRFDCTPPCNGNAEG